ncbi:MAG: ceramidase domain-containing protein [Desulfuromonadales bacterium]|nr:ceramidase domain-containing protein [Desulfuromonadales bacterium]
MDHLYRLYGLLVLISLGFVVLVALLPPISQDPSYHHFTDGRHFFGIPNFLNVISNLPMFLIGLSGLYTLGVHRHMVFADQRESQAYGVFFLGAVLVGAGSAWYHLAPDNLRLFWDRLPMALMFMAFTSAMLAERVSVAFGSRALLPLLAAGIASVVWWHLTEQAGFGDLRPYGFVHFYPAILIPLLLLLFPPRYTREGEVWGVLFLFVLTVVCEHFDRALFTLGSLVSGHTFKHLFAGVAVGLVLHMLVTRELSRKLK